MKNKQRLRFRILSRLAFAGSLIAVPAVPAAQAGGDRPVDAGVLNQTGRAFARIAERTTPAVVFVQVDKTMNVNIPVQPYLNQGNGYYQPLQPRYKQEEFHQTGQGSGFIISKDGYILTNHHVVGEVDKIRVKLTDGREFDGHLVGTDPKSEVALLKIDAGKEDLPYLELGDSGAIRVGEWAIAIGNPFGLNATLTVGVISATGRNDIGITDFENFIQTDAAINPGNSGGPLLDINGKVIGINTAIFSQSGGSLGIGFAIPVNMAKRIKDQLIHTGTVRRGYLGVYIQDLTPDLAHSFDLERGQGILVSDVGPDSPAEKSGLRPGDIIRSIDGKDAGNVAAFRNLIAALNPGAKIALTLMRDGKEQQLDIVVGELPNQQASVQVAERLRQMGLEVEALTPELAKRLGYHQEEGVVVSQVYRAGPAARAGIRPGNLVTSINRTPVSRLEDFQAAFKDLGSSVLLSIRDPEASRFVVLELE